MAELIGGLREAMEQQDNTFCFRLVVRQLLTVRYPDAVRQLSHAVSRLGHDSIDPL